MGGYGMEYWKPHGIFSESHHILMDLLYVPGRHDLTNDVVIDADHNSSMHSEVYNAWRAAGGGENLPNIAQVKQLGKWGVGFGGKKNGDRAAKLALALAIAMDGEPHVDTVRRNYPSFGWFLDHMQNGGGAAAGGMGDMMGGMGMMGGCNPY